MNQSCEIFKRAPRDICVRACLGNIIKCPVCLFSIFMSVYETIYPKNGKLNSLNFVQIAKILVKVQIFMMAKSKILNVSFVGDTVLWAEINVEKKQTGYLMIFSRR